jgi:glycosyltransferase involved in cell wall biosynthesis
MHHTLDDPAPAAGAESVRLLRKSIWSHPRWNGLTPRVSVIIPTFNRARHLPATIASVFEQTFDIHELVLVDDGSTDGTDRVVKALAVDHPEWRGRLKYRRQDNRGKSAALNAGLALASGDWIAFNDSDDRWLPEKLELQFTALSEYADATACFTDVRFANNPAFNKTGFEMARLGRTSPFGFDECTAPLYFVGWPGIYMQSIVVHRSAMAQVGAFDVDLRMAMDFDFGFRLGLVSPMCYVNRPLVEIDRTPDRTIGLTTEFPVDCVERLQAQRTISAKWLRATRESHPELAARIRHRLWADQSALANHYLLKDDRSAARSILGRAALQNPKPRAVAKFVWSVVSPGSLKREIVRRLERRHQSQSVALNDERLPRMQTVIDHQWQQDRAEAVDPA